MSVLKGPFKDGRPRRRVLIDGSESAMLQDRDGYEGKVKSVRRRNGLCDMVEASRFEGLKGSLCREQVQERKLLSLL